MVAEDREARCHHCGRRWMVSELLADDAGMCHCPICDSDNVHPVEVPVLTVVN